MKRIIPWAILAFVLAAPLPVLAQAPIISYYSGPPVVVDPVYYPPAVSYYRAPAVTYYQPAPVYYSAPVTYYQPSTVSYYQPAPVSYYQPAPVVTYRAPVYYSPVAPVGVTTYRYGLLGLRTATTVNYGW